MDFNFSNIYQSLFTGNKVNSNNNTTPVNYNDISTPKAPTALTTTGIFSRFQTGDIVPNVKQEATEAVWSGGIGGIMTTFYSSSTQYSSSGTYYINIYATNPQTDSEAEVQFAAAYGNYYGSGSAMINALSGDASLTSTKAIYSQYANLLLPSTVSKFSMGDGNSIDEFFVVNFNRARVKQELDAGNWELTLSGSTGVITLVDDSIVDAAYSVSEGGHYYNIISGSLATSTGYQTGGAYVYYGIMYPEYGTLILNANTISGSIEIPIDHTTAGENCQVFYNALNDGASFAARNSQTINSTYYFVRIKNAEFNFSNNPSFTTGSYGDLRHAEMIGDPKVYITTVGLYNDNNELLAVAKVSKPILKSFTTEATLRVKLDF